MSVLYDFLVNQKIRISVKKHQYDAFDMDSVFKSTCRKIGKKACILSIQIIRVDDAQ